MKDSRVYVDMDGVLANWVRGVANVFGVTDEKVTGPIPGLGFSCAEKNLEITQEELWMAIDGCPGFWENLEPYPWWGAIMSEAVEFGKTPFILSTPSRNANSSSGKVKWLQNCFGNSFRAYILTEHKYLLAQENTILIDDSDVGCKKFYDAGGSSILFPQWWNNNHGSTEDRVAFVRSELEDWKRLGRRPDDL